jgi:hypothetical protein
MFESVYRWGMRCGSRLLFWLAVTLVIAGFVQGFQQVGKTGPDGSVDTDWALVTATLLQAFSWAVLPLLGSMLIDRMDRWLGDSH